MCAAAEPTKASTARAKRTGTGFARCRTAGATKATITTASRTGEASKPCRTGIATKGNGGAGSTTGKYCEAEGLPLMGIRHGPEVDEYEILGEGESKAA